MPDEDQNKAIAARAAADAKAQRKSREQQLKDERDASEAATKEQQERVSNLRPTPTQEENDRAKLGLNTLEDLDNKEDHGAPEERSVSAAEGTAGAKNRSVSTK
jgi:hypothetical protein